MYIFWTRPSVMEKSRENEGRVALQREELGVGVGLGVSRKMGGSREGKLMAFLFPWRVSEDLDLHSQIQSESNVNSYQRPSWGTSCPSHPPLGDFTAV